MRSLSRHISVAVFVIATLLPYEAHKFGGLNAVEMTSVFYTMKMRTLYFPSVRSQDRELNLVRWFQR